MLAGKALPYISAAWCWAVDRFRADPSPVGHRMDVIVQRDGPDSALASLPVAVFPAGKLHHMIDGSDHAVGVVGIPENAAHMAGQTLKSGIAVVMNVVYWNPGAVVPIVFRQQEQVVHHLVRPFARHPQPLP